MKVSRIDFTGKFDSNRRTPQGGLKVPAYLTRTGVLTYRQPDGSVIRELRHPDEVFNTDSLASLAGAPVTIGHPGKVAPENYTKHSVGHVGDTVVPAEDRFVSATLRIQDAKAVTAIEKGELLELSCGYDCDMDMTPGEYNGEKYDGIQRGIVYNHLALLPKNGGRAGNDVKIRLDGITEIVSNDGAACKLTEMSTDDLKRLEDQAVEIAELKRLKQDAEDKLSTATKELETAKGANASLTAQVATLSDPARMDALVAKTVAFHSDARVILGADAEIKGSEREVLVTSLTKCDASFKADGLSDDYLRGQFAMEVKRTKSGAASIAAVRSDADKAASAAPVDLVETAKRKGLEKMDNAWKTPSSIVRSSL